MVIKESVREVTGIRPDELPDWILSSAEPVVLKGLVSDWPIVQAARQSATAADAYLRRYYQDATVGAAMGPPEIKGRIFYNDDLTGFNFQLVKLKLNVVLDKIQQHQDDARPPVFYVGSTTVDTCLPGFRAENDLDFGDVEPLASVWLGNKTRVAAHYDVPDNMACCVVGRRRFILFPPEELENLYVGPLDFTPAGQTISLVDFQQPDFEKHSKFREALKNAQQAEMEPGDAIFIPSMWWHHVEGLDDFNVLINYWWRQSPAWMGPPVNALEHALLSLRQLPPEQRKAWQEIFRFYVFDFDEESIKHIPEHRHGLLARIDETGSRKLRAQLLNKLNR